MNEATKERDELMERALAKKEKRIDIEETRILEATYAHMKREIERITKSKNANILKLQVQYKQQALAMREKYVARIMQAVREKLEAFASSPDYDAFFGGALETAKAQPWLGVILLSQRDEKRKAAVEALGFVCEVSSEIHIGGVIGMDAARTRQLDLTLDTRYRKESEGFLERNDLSFAATNL